MHRALFWYICWAFFFFLTNQVLASHNHHCIRSGAAHGSAATEEQMFKVLRQAHTLNPDRILRGIEGMECADTDTALPRTATAEIIVGLKSILTMGPPDECGVIGCQVEWGFARVSEFEMVNLRSSIPGLLRN